MVQPPADLSADAWSAFVATHGGDLGTRDAACFASLAQLVAHARLAWPKVLPDDRAFCEFVGRAFAGLADPSDSGWLDRAPDLYLAWACAAGQEAACESLVAAYSDKITAAVSRVLADAGEREEAVQKILDELLVARDGRPPKVALYKGRGPLRAFVAVVAANTARNLARRAPREKHSECELDQLAVGSGDPELGYLRKLYGSEFRASFEVALANLDASQRLLLKLDVIDRLTVRQSAPIYGRSPATTARHLARARAEVAQATMADLRRRLNLSPSLVDSIARLVRSDVHLSIERLLMADS